ncbi:MAG: histidine kinase [Bacteroidetes bacterium]|nr:histidine kinase [Bacteroidota bacterium]
MLFRRNSYLIILVLLSLNIKAQQHYFERFGAEHGLPFVQVSCLFQDSKGYLWSGGYGGLSRFDGLKFQNFSKKNGLLDNNVNSICEDANGLIYIATNKGLNILQDKKITASKFKALRGLKVTYLKFVYPNIIYVGTQKGLYKIENSTITSVISKKINCIYYSKNTLYAGTDYGIAIIKNNGTQFITTKNKLPSNQINCITEFSNQLTVGTSNGLCFIDSNKVTVYHIENGIIDENILSLRAFKNNLWVGAQSGLLKFNGTTFKYYNVDNDNNSNFIVCLLNDNEQNLWVGTHIALFKYRDDAFVTFDKVNGPGNAFVYQIFRDSKGILWLCSENNGIYKYDNDLFIRYGIKDGLTTNACRSGIELKKGELLFGLDKDVMSYDYKVFKKISLPPSFKGPYESIYKDKNALVWIGGSNGICSIDFSKTKVTTKFYESLGTNVSFIGFCEDSNHGLYVGTYGKGLYQLKKDKLISVNQLLNIKEDFVYSPKFYNGNLFACTLNGLLIIDLEKKTHSYITEEDGLNSDLVYSIEVSKNKNYLWIGTNQGINRLTLSPFNSKKRSVKNYGKEDGFAGVECNTNGIWEDSYGTLWFGTVSGLVKHEPKSRFENSLNNNPLIQNIKLNSSDTLLKNNSELPYALNTISFYYRTINLTSPNKVLYKKMLEGLEKEWSTPSKEDYSKYTNLLPGKYVFKVISCNDLGIWSNEETKFSFTIKPPIYFTWWFILIITGIILITVYLFIFLRIKSIKKRQKDEFIKKVEMSKLELKALRSQMNPHFVFNSLNSIQHYIYNNKGDEATKYLNKFAKLIRSILNNSDKNTVTIDEDIDALKLYIELEQMRFEGKFDYTINIHQNVDTDYDIMPPLIMQPYVENAILHGINPNNIKGKLTIEIYIKEKFLVCSIVDNGIGREKSKEIKRTIPGKNHKSFGMKITEDRLRILNESKNSQLSVKIYDLTDEHKKPLGTKVELFIPLN